ncbi:hypothetical protein SODALDRAFT_350787 [Sodiomyces alkalinus F11]|uniref:DUF7896 domain-containing protein n=1 Tax=Sodiomyces alkalinus (strain CBS 110278 / VKM F-3762 / F11) TaxID=1314773 RepID=A0A3N2PVP8_SODAK|nr:hypothetical protein SODALDRAFT_350787 [Sodiomyces alkalinus F11]ROT38583.1 hypothetical protein SODALDRAFT_350787 [Sodiomyces alkalinus F11]
MEHHMAWRQLKDMGQMGEALLLQNSHYTSALLHSSTSREPRIHIEALWLVSQQVIYGTSLDGVQYYEVLQDRDSTTQQPVKRARVMSQQHMPWSISSQPVWQRNLSGGSNSVEPFAAFVAEEPAARLPATDPANANMHAFASSLQRAPSSQQTFDLPSVQEHDYGRLGVQFGGPDVGMSPLDFLKAQDDGPSSPGLIPPPPQEFPGSYDSNGRFSSSRVISTCPSMTSGVSGVETIPLSRDGSMCDNQSLPGAFRMARLDSTQSLRTDFTGSDAFSFNWQDAITGDERDDLFRFPENGSDRPTADSSSLYHLYASSAPTGQFTLNGCGAGMERSISMSSAMSSQSNAGRRAREARQRQIKNAQRARLLPKPQAAAKASEASAARKDGRVAMAKNGGSSRSKRVAKVFCETCNEYPGGFRGEHELKRHILAKHQGVVKKFVCRDPATAGIPSTVPIVIPLDACKNCLNRKEYGAYYNAAAHLRRTHFNPKQSRGKTEKRGGKGGGDWPHMDELKKWFEEVLVEARNDTEAGPETDSDAEGEAEVEVEAEVDTEDNKPEMVLSSSADTSFAAGNGDDNYLYGADGVPGYSYSLTSDAMMFDPSMTNMASDAEFSAGAFSEEATPWSLQDETYYIPFAFEAS